MTISNFKKYQIFISSTYTDLIDERKLIIDALRKSALKGKNNSHK